MIEKMVLTHVASSLQKSRDLPLRWTSHQDQKSCKEFHRTWQLQSGKDNTIISLHTKIQLLYAYLVPYRVESAEPVHMLD